VHRELSVAEIEKRTVLIGRKNHALMLVKKTTRATEINQAGIAVVGQRSKQELVLGNIVT